VNKGVWEEAIREDADKKGVEPCDRFEGKVCTMKRKGIPALNRGERGGKRICKEAAEERIHPAIKVTINGTSIFCRKEGWEEKDGARLQVSK